jgi:hypothetical protein
MRATPGGRRSARRIGRQPRRAVHGWGVFRGGFGGLEKEEGLGEKTMPSKGDRGEKKVIDRDKREGHSSGCLSFSTPGTRKKNEEMRRSLPFLVLPIYQTNTIIFFLPKLLFLIQDLLTPFFPLLALASLVVLMCTQPRHLDPEILRQPIILHSISCN